MKTQNILLKDFFQAYYQKLFAGKQLHSKPARIYAFVIALVLSFSFEFSGMALGQSPGSGTRRGTNLSGDVKVDESKVKDAKPTTFDVILYAKSGEVVGRQKVGNNGRYRFLNLFNGEYDIAIEVENSEIARIPLVITGGGGPATGQYTDEVRQDLELQWTPGIGGRAAKPSTVSAGDFYERKEPNKDRFLKAQASFDKKEFESAITLFKQIVTDDPQDFQAWSELGTVYLVQNNLNEAEKTYQKATEIRPTFFLALMNLGRLRLKQKNYEGAITALEQAVAVQPTSAETNYLLGGAYLQIKKGSKAVGYLNEALRLEPIKMAEAHLRLATLYNGAGYKDRAAAEYEAFLKKQPDYADRKKLEQYIEANKAKSSNKP